MLSVAVTLGARMQWQLRKENNIASPDALADMRIPKEHPIAHPQLIVK